MVPCSDIFNPGKKQMLCLWSCFLSWYWSDMKKNLHCKQRNIFNLIMSPGKHFIFILIGIQPCAKTNLLKICLFKSDSDLRIFLRRKPLIVYVQHHDEPASWSASWKIEKWTAAECWMPFFWLQWTSVGECRMPKCQMTLLSSLLNPSLTILPNLLPEIKWSYFSLVHHQRIFIPGQIIIRPKKKNVYISK